METKVVITKLYTPKSEGEQMSWEYLQIYLLIFLINILLFAKQTNACI